MACHADHHLEFHHRLNDLRKRGVFTDIKVTAAGQRSFDCHKVVLSAISPYFETMLQANMIEAATGEIQLTFDEETVAAVLNYIYTGEQFLSRSNVLQVYQAAHMLQISPLITMCERFLQTEMGKENCLGIWKISKLLGRSDMAGVAQMIVLQSFAEICSVEAFDEADLSIEDLKSLLVDPFINCTSSVKCKAAVIWLALQEDVDQDFIVSLFLYVMKYCGVTAEDFQESLNENNTAIWSQLPSASEALPRRSKFQEVVRRLSSAMPSAQSNTLQTRYDEGLVVIGGNDMRSNTFMMTLNLRDHKWYTLEQLPEDPGFYFAVCCSGTSLFLTGGSKRNKQFLQYDVVENAWIRLPNLPIGREGHGMVGFDSAIYTFGGNTNPPSCKSYAEMYIKEDRSWRKVGEIAKPIYSPSYCVLENRIYIFGRSMIGETAPSDWAQYYDTRDNLSGNLDFKLPFRSKASTLLAVAGTSGIYFVYKGDIYSLNPKKRAQKVLPLSPGPHKGAGAVCYGEKILIVGGEDDNFRILDTIVLFNPVTNDAMALPAKTPWSLTAFHFAKIKIPTALVHGLKEVRSCDGAILAIGY